MPRSLRRVVCGALLAGGGALGAPGLCAQVLTGRVVDAGTSRPLAGLAVVLLPATSGDTAAGMPPRRDTAALATAVSGADGVFMLAAPRPGTYRARIGAAFVTPPVGLASVESFEAREYRLVGPAAAPDSAASPPGARFASADRAGAPACSKEAVLAARAASRDSAAGGQALRTGSAGTGGSPTLCAFQVEKQASALPGTLWARYPDEFRNPATAPVQARVVVQFVVDEHGRADMATFKVLEASDPAFVAPLWEGVTRARFAPAEIGHRAVRQLVQLPFTFTLITGPGRGRP